MQASDVKTLYFKEDGPIPNNSSLPVLLYKKALEGKLDRCEEIFNSNNWTNSWTNGVFDYHHYHSNTHEVLGVISGGATIKLGGENGNEVKVAEGDVVVLPAGTGHKRIDASSNFKVVGAYPDGIQHNLKTGENSVRFEDMEDIEQVPIPEEDPIYGKEGPLTSLWK
ncbi:cupin domain-containing protein [Pseudalkalibacillus caeni]